MTLFRNRYRIETTRSEDWDYRSGGWYFVTICTKDRRCSLGTMIDGAIVLSPAGLIAESRMPLIAAHHANVWVDIFVIMPNHVHAIIVREGLHRHSPDSNPSGFVPGVSLADVVGGYKAGASRSCRLQGINDFSWQPRFYDRILGSNVAVSAVRDYIRKNPSNWLDDPDNPKAIKALRSSPSVP